MLNSSQRNMIPNLCKGKAIQIIADLSSVTMKARRNWLKELPTQNPIPDKNIFQTWRGNQDILR